MKQWGWLPPRSRRPERDGAGLVGGVAAALGRDLTDAERACLAASVDRLSVVGRARRRSALGRAFPRQVGRHARGSR